MDTLLHGQNRCRHCTEIIVADNGQYVHLDENMRPAAPYVQKCLDCGWKGSTRRYFRNCPACGTLSLINDHKAQK